MIPVKVRRDGTVEILTGGHRFKSMIEKQGYADLCNTETNESLRAYEIGDKMIVLDQAAQNRLEQQASDFLKPFLC